MSVKLDKAADAMVELCVMRGLCLNIYVESLFDTKLYGESKVVAASYVTIAVSYSHKNPPGNVGIGTSYFRKIKKDAKTVLAS